MQPSINPELLAQLEPYLSADVDMRQLLEAAIDNYLGWQKFLGSITPNESANAELERKFNHLLLQSEQAQADLRQLIKDANDRISQQAIWIDRELGAVKNAIKDIRQNLTIADSTFSPSETEVLRKFARSMGAVEPVKIEQNITGRVTPQEIEAAKQSLSPKSFQDEYEASFEDELTCTDDFCPTPKRAAIDPKADQEIEASRIVELIEGDSIAQLQNLNRQQLGKLLTQYKIPHRNSEGKVWRVDEMRQMLAEKMPSTETAIAQTVTKKRGRLAKSKAA